MGPAERRPVRAPERGPGEKPRKEPGQVRLERDGRIATVTIDRPAARNAMDRAMWVALRAVMERLSGEDAGVRAVVVRGAGGTFCAGSDIKEMQGRTTEEAEETFRLVEAALAAVERVPVPVIAAVNGVAAGGGCELMLAADLRIAAPSARIGMPVARLGIHVSPAFVSRLVRVVGASRAGDLLLSGRLIGGEEAHLWGLVHALVSEDQVEQEAHRLAERIARYSPSSLRHSKRLLKEHGREAERRGGAGDGSHRFIGSPDEFWEGVSAFLEKREPDFT